MSDKYLTERIRAAAPLIGLLAATALITTLWLAYISRAVPLVVHILPARYVPAMTRLALAALVVVLAADAAILVAVWWRQRSESSAAPTSSSAALLPRTADTYTFAATALASTVVFFGLGFVGLPLWFMAAAALLPWAPLYFSAAVWQYRHYGAFAIFGTLVLLQLGHLSEHIVQNIQLLLSHGRLAVSRGVFGQLDVETVHFYWNIGLWLATGVLLFRYGLRNVWLTMAFLAASLHSVEHIYMYWLYVTHSAAYLAGGWNGILGEGGLVGSPLARPYLHLLYNVVEVAPFLIAYYEQSRRVVDLVPVKPAARKAAVGAL